MKGVAAEYGKIQALIECGWLTEAQAKQWFKEEKTQGMTAFDEAALRR
jgi:hypothetical protein